MTPDILEVQEDKALEMAARMRRVEVNVDGLDRPVGTALVGGGGVKSENPVVLLHGFDSNSLEFRRFFPLLSKEMETWAIDLVVRREGASQRCNRADAFIRKHRSSLAKVIGLTSRALSHAGLGLHG